MILEFEELRKESENSMHKGIEATKNTSHLEDLNSCLVWLEGRIYTKDSWKETSEQKVINRSCKNRFMACSTGGRTIHWEMEYKKSKFDVYVIVWEGAGKKKLGL